MTRKQIDAGREIRLWIGQVIVPAVTGAIILASNPNVRFWVKSKVDGIKQSIKNKKNRVH